MEDREILEKPLQGGLEIGRLSGISPTISVEYMNTELRFPQLPPM